MPVSTTSNIHFSPGAGLPPGTPTAVTSIAKDAGAVVSFRPPASTGDGPVTSWTVTPYTGGSAQAPTTVAAAAAGSITGSDGNTYVQVTIGSGLSNGTAYTFTAKASSSFGTGPESAQSGANTPLAGLVFGDDFGGPAGGPIDPEWWVYTRCGWLTQNEVQYYLPSQTQLDGNGNLLLIADHTSYTGPRYPSDPSYPGQVTQPWRSGAVQSNTKTWQPATGNTMTFEARHQVCPDAGAAMWPGLFWLVGQDYIQTWKTDPQQSWDNAGKAEIDVAEWWGQGTNGYVCNLINPSGHYTTVGPITDFSASMHTFSVKWKPGVSCTWWRDGSTQTLSITSGVPGTATRWFMMLYLQIVAGTAASPQHCTIDYVRVYDQNLG